MLDDGVARLSDLQEQLYASNSWAVLIVLQAMDAAGKDGVIEHVMTGLNPQGVDVHAFKQPSAEELDHDFLWRARSALPQRGSIGIFNRSYYEEVLVVRVHSDVLEAEQLPTGAGRQGHLAAPLPRYPWLRRASGRKRHAGPQILPQRLEGRAAQAFPRPHRPAGQALEIFHE